MHFMLIGALLHATVLGIIAFFILFAAQKAEGVVTMLGRILGLWVLLLAILALVIGVGSFVTGKPMMGMDGPGWMHHRWEHMGPPPWDRQGAPDDGKPAAPPQPVTPAPAQPAPPTPGKPG